MDTDILLNYSLGPDWFREGIAKAREKFDYKKRTIIEKYCFRDPNNGLVMLIDGITHLSKGSEKKYTEEVMDAREEYNKEIGLLKKKLLKDG